MIRTLALAAVFALAAGSVSAQKIDAYGKCHGADGKFAKMDVCKGASAEKPKAGPATAVPAAKPTAGPATPTAGPATPAKSAKCKDAKGKFAKCGTPGATPVLDKK
jgi:hypothetical protein